MKFALNCILKILNSSSGSVSPVHLIASVDIDGLVGVVDATNNEKLHSILH